MLATLVPALLLSFEAVRSTAALTIAASGDRDSLARAVALDPLNPALQDRLGVDYVNGLEEPDPQASLQHLQRAVRMSPERASYWEDLASTCESVNDFACAGSALERTLRLAPMTPRLYWLAANYHLRRSQLEAALPLFRTLLKLDPQYARPTFDACLRMLKDPALVERNVLPEGKDTSLALAYADLLMTRGRLESAQQAWARAVRDGSQFSFSQAQSYIERLMNAGQGAQAASAWADLERLGVVGPPDTGNLAYNGGFERPPLDAGFDWRYHEAPYVAADFQDPAAYEGRRCLRLDFMGSNSEFEPVFQFIPVEPHQRYLITAEARSEGISSDSGPRLRVLDADCPACLDVASDMVVGMTPWHEISVSVTTGPQTRLLKLSIWRPRSRAFPTEITGRFWLDAVRLRPEPAAAITALDRNVFRNDDPD